MRLAMQNVRFRLWILPVAALIGASGFLLADGMNGAFSALSAFGAVLLPSEWTRAKALSARPETAFALGLSKILLTILLLAAAVKAMGAALAPAAFVLGVVFALVVGIFRFRSIFPQPVEIGGNS